MIIAARQLGNAVRGDGSNIEKKKFTAAALQQKSGALLQDPAFKEFIASYRNTYDVEEVIDGHSGALEDKLDAWVKKEVKQGRELGHDSFSRYFFNTEAEKDAPKLDAKGDAKDGKQEANEPDNDPEEEGPAEGMYETMFY